MKREIEYQFSEYTNLIEINDVSIFDKSISFDDYHTVFMAKKHNSVSVLLGVNKVWTGLRNKQYLYYLVSTEDEENNTVEHEWYCEGEIEDK